MGLVETNGVGFLPLSSRQYQVLAIIDAHPTSTRDLDKATGSRCTEVLKSLNQQGSIKYVGGIGVRQGRGKWCITERGRKQLCGGPT